MDEAGSQQTNSGTRSRTVTWEEPLRAAQAGAAMSGIDYLRAIANSGSLRRRSLLCWGWK